MKAVMMFVLLLVSGMVSAMDMAELNECIRITKKYTETPFQLTIAEYDTMSLCGYNTRRTVVDNEQLRKEDRAIERNFNKTPLSDGE